MHSKYSYLLRRCAILSPRFKLMSRQFNVSYFNTNMIMDRHYKTLMQNSKAHMPQIISTRLFSRWEVSCDWLQKKREKEKMLLIDVRSPDEIEAYGGIPGAINIPMEELDSALKLPDVFFERKYGRSKKLDEDDDDGENLVLFCQRGVRSLHAAAYARSIGLVEAKNLTGGYMAWKKYDESQKNED